MKIIHEGKLPDEEYVERTCSYCKTVVGFNLKEGRKSHYNADQRDQREESTTTYTVDCPLCKRGISYIKSGIH